MKKFIVSISFTVFFLFISVDANGKCQANSETQTKTPLQVLNVFYTVLVDDNHDTLPNIFININFAAKMITGREYNDIKAKKIVRQYLRQNKALFLFSLQNINTNWRCYMYHVEQFNDVEKTTIASNKNNSDCTKYSRNLNIKD